MKPRLGLFVAGCCLFSSMSYLSYSRRLKEGLFDWEGDPLDKIGAGALMSFYSSDLNRAKKLFAALYGILTDNPDAVSAESKWNNPMARWNLLKTIMQLERELNPSNLFIAQYMISSVLPCLLFSPQETTENHYVILADACMTAADILNHKGRLEEARSYLDLGLSLLNPHITKIIENQNLMIDCSSLFMSMGNLLETSGENFMAAKDWINGYGHFHQAYILLMLLPPDTRERMPTFNKIDIPLELRRSVYLYQMASCLVGLQKYNEAKHICEELQLVWTNASLNTSFFEKIYQIFSPNNVVSLANQKNQRLSTRYKIMNTLLLSHINLAQGNYEHAMDILDMLNSSLPLDLKKEAFELKRQIIDFKNKKAPEGGLEPPTF